MWEISRDGLQHIATWVDDDRTVLTLRARDTPTRPDTRTLTAFPIRADDVVVRSTFDMVGSFGDEREPGGATVALGAHPIAEKLAALGLDRESLRHGVFSHASATLDRARVIGQPTPLRTAAPGHEPLVVAAAS